MTSVALPIDNYQPWLGDTSVTEPDYTEFAP